MEWLRHRLGTERLRLALDLLVVGYPASLLWQALMAVDDPGRLARVPQAVALLAFGIVVVTSRHLHRRVPILHSRNPYLSAARWVASMYLIWGIVALTAPYQLPLTVWVLSGILIYGVAVVLMQIQQQSPE